MRFPNCSLELGEAIKMITQQAHPSTIAPELPPALKEAVKFLGSPVAEIRSFRIARMAEFERAAHDRKAEKTSQKRVKDQNSEQPNQI